MALYKEIEENYPQVNYHMVNCAVSRIKLYRQLLRFAELKGRSLTDHNSLNFFFFIVL